ncbi:MAG: DMT family transporter [Clostridia bacterium]|nr:DMT family transporter [Clostridia bacterium]
MSFPLFTIITTVMWGVAELFYKKGAREDEKYAHLKISICVGVVMGIHALFTILFRGINYDLMNLLIYLPVSACYILSMTLSYFGMRFVAESISDPIENTSGAICSLLCVAFLGAELSGWSYLAIAAIVCGILGLGFLEKNANELRKQKLGKKMAVVAFAMPFCYAIIDALGSFLDAFYLDEVDSSPLVNITEDTMEEVANTSYELTFFIVAVVLFIFLKVKRVKFELPKQGDKIAAAVCETAGQFTYVYAMSDNAAVAAPIFSCSVVISVLLSKIFLKEKITWKQYIFIAIAIIGVIVLSALNPD